MEIYQNPIALRVQGGTVNGSLDLCASCRYGVHRAGALSGFSEMRCSAIQGMPLVPEKLARCSMYLERGKLALHEMADIAWIIEEKGKHIGFLSPEELKRRQQFGSTPPTSPIGF